MSEKIRGFVPYDTLLEETIGVSLNEFKDISQDEAWRMIQSILKHYKHVDGKGHKGVYTHYSELLQDFQGAMNGDEKRLERFKGDFYSPKNIREDFKEDVRDGVISEEDLRAMIVKINDLRTFVLRNHK